MSLLTTALNGDAADATASTPWAALTGSGPGGTPGPGDTLNVGHQLTVSTPLTVGLAAGVVAGAGTVSTSGNTCTGSGTAFLTDYRVGDIIVIDSGAASVNPRVVTAVANDGSLTFGASGFTRTNVAYTIVKVGIYLTAAGSRLIVNAPLTIAGTLTLNCTNGSITDIVTIAAGAGIEFDVPSGQRMPVATTTLNNQRSRIRLNGSAGNEAYIRSKFGGGTAWLSRFTAAAGGYIRGSYCNFTRLYDGSMHGVETLADDLTLDHYTFDASGSLSWLTDLGVSGTLSLTDGQHINGVSTSSLISTMTSTKSGGTRDIHRCYFDKQLGGSPGQTWQDANFYRDVLMLGIGVAGTVRWARFEEMLWRRTASRQTTLILGDILNCYILDDHTGTNPLAVSPIANFGGSTTLTIDGTVWDYWGSDGAGDFFQCQTQSAPKTVRLYRNLVLPARGNPTGASAGYVLGAGNVNNITTVVEHNTATVFANGGGYCFGETVAARAGFVSSFKSNIAYGVTNGVVGTMVYDFAFGGTPTLDVIAIADIDKNCAYRVAAGSAGRGYNSSHTGTPGLTDLPFNTNPLFVDVSRDISTWDASLGGPGTRASALERLRVDKTLIAALRTHVRGGWAPTELLLKDAGHDGATVGAVEGVFPSVGGNRPRWWPGLRGTSPPPVFRSVRPPRRPNRGRR